MRPPKTVAVSRILTLLKNPELIRIAVVEIGPVAKKTFSVLIICVLPDGNRKLSITMSLIFSIFSAFSDTIQNVIKRDHDHIRDTYALYKKSSNPKERRKLANEFICAVAVHFVAEEVVMYPVIESRMEMEKDPLITRVKNTLLLRRRYMKLTK